MKQKLGKLETQFFAYAQMRQWRTVRAGALTGPLRLTARQERKLLSRLARAGMIARVWRGVYLVPPRLPLGGKWSPGEILALTTLVEDRGGRYQICGPNAFNRYGFDEQVPNRVYAYNNRISGERTVGSVALTLIKVADERLGDTEEIETAEGAKAVYASRVRTLVDAVYDWSRFNSLPRGYDWIRKELSAKRVRAEDLVRVTLQYGDKGTTRRMGVLLEGEGVDAALLRKLERALPPSTGLIPWIPGYSKRGTVNRRWGVVVNDNARSPRD
jgi:predicted transcriptional regulator of viral defense system